MIFITVGGEKFQFNRLFAVMDNDIKSGAITDEVFAQIGVSEYAPKFFKYKRYMPFDEVLKFVRESDIVISHAGVGTVILCLKEGEIPIVLPREENFKEHVDDHQVEFAKKMEEEGKILLAKDEKDVLDKIKNYKKLISKMKPYKISDSSDKLVSYLKTIVEEKD